MARGNPTPTAPTEEPEQVVTPLQKMLTGTLLLSLILAPIMAWGLYLAPFYKASGALYRGEYFLIGLALAIVAAAVFSYLWMAVLPGFLVKREERRAARAVEQKAAKREAGRKSREADAQAAKDAAEEE